MTTQLKKIINFLNLNGLSSFAPTIQDDNKYYLHPEFTFFVLKDEKNKFKWAVCVKNHETSDGILRSLCYETEDGPFYYLSKSLNYHSIGTVDEYFNCLENDDILTSIKAISPNKLTPLQAINFVEYLKSNKIAWEKPTILTKELLDFLIFYNLKASKSLVGI